jgi:hypothetical protein
MNIFRLIDVHRLKVIETSFDAFESAGGRQALQALHSFDILFSLPFAQIPPTVRTSIQLERNDWK